ncbi:MAG: ribosome maturation factor [Saprospiraceae bacterium]|nr:ribosome maturation factor [Saprospiraceae bacterium]
MQNLELEKLVLEGLTQLEYVDTYLVDIRVKNNKIEVFLDSDEGISFLKCQKMSRWLESFFDENKTFGDVYTLEVSSPGVGSPLKMLRQYPKNIGRIIDIKHSIDKQSKGILKDVIGDKIYVEYEIKIKEGKKNKKVIMTDEIKFEDIIESKIKISFN